MSTPAPLLAAEWPLVGRDTEMATIAQAREDAHCRGVVVSAPAGIGKSRLARESHNAAGRAGASIDWVQATRSAAAVPLGAFAAVLPPDVGSDDALELMRLSSTVLRERAETRPVVLAVDDAQLLDPVSAALVLHLAVTDSAFIIATVRVGEPCPDAITSLWKDAGARRLELARLSDEAIGTLVETALQGPLEQRALRWIVERSQGNALFARELVLGAVKAGSLKAQAGLWQLVGDPQVTTTLLDVIAGRIADLDNDIREALELLALGEPLRMAEMAGLSSYPALEAAESLGLLTVTASESLRLAHPLHGEALRAELKTLRAAQLRLKIAAVLEQRAPLRPVDALRIAHLRTDAGAPISHDVQQIAAVAAIHAGDPDFGGRLAEEALKEGAGLGASLVLAHAHIARKRYADAEQTFAAAEQAIRTDPRAITYLEQRTQVLYWGLNRPHEARALLDRAAGWSDDPSWHNRLAPLRLGFVDAAAAVDTLEGVLDQELDEETATMARRRLTVALFFAGRTHEALARAREDRPTIPLRGYGDALALGIWRLIGIETGEIWDELDKDMAGVLKDGVRANDNEAAGHGALGRAFIAFGRGRFHTATRWLAEAELHFEKQDTFGNLLHVRALRVGVHCATGDDRAAAAAHAHLRATLGDHVPLSSQRPILARADGWAARAAGHLADARRSLLHAATDLHGMPVYAGQLLHDALIAGASPAEVADRFQVVVDQCDARLTATYADHANALATKDGAALMTVAETLASLGTTHAAMQAAVHAAEVFVEEGRTDSARRAAHLARELHVPNEGTAEPHIDGLDSVAIGLTAREQQIVDLAGQGLSNAEIADRLVLSVRTVESHIYRAMHKLGINDRRDFRTGTQ